MDYIICRRQMSSLHVKQVEYSILWIKHLFQNGRVLLKCRIIIPPTTGNPDVEKSRSHAPVTTRTCPLWTDISRRSAYFSSLFVVFRFRAFCVVVELHSSHSFANFTANYSSFSCAYCENSTGLTSLIPPFALFSAFCVVVEFHSSHSFANFSVTYSSFS